MKNLKPDKTTPLDEFSAESRPAPEPIDDAKTLAKLDALKAPDLDEAEPPAAVIAKIPEHKRAEASRALKSRIQRIRAFALGEVEDPDL